MLIVCLLYLHWIDTVATVKAKGFPVLDFIFFSCDDVEERWGHHRLCPENVFSNQNCGNSKTNPIFLHITT